MLMQQYKNIGMGDSTCGISQVLDKDQTLISSLQIPSTYDLLKT